MLRMEWMALGALACGILGITLLWILTETAQPQRVTLAQLDTLPDNTLVEFTAQITDTRYQTNDVQLTFYASGITRRGRGEKTLPIPNTPLVRVRGRIEHYRNNVSIRILQVTPRA